jgi:hypothetical protein
MLTQQDLDSIFITPKTGNNLGGDLVSTAIKGAGSFVSGLGLFQ